MRIPKTLNNSHH